MHVMLMSRPWREMPNTQTLIFFSSTGVAISSAQSCPPCSVAGDLIVSCTVEDFVDFAVGSEGKSSSLGTIAVDFPPRPPRPPLLPLPLISKTPRPLED